MPSLAGSFHSELEREQVADEGDERDWAGAGRAWDQREAPDTVRKDGTLRESFFLLSSQAVLVRASSDGLKGRRRRGVRS